MADQVLQEKNTLYAPKFPENWDESFLYPLADWINGMAFKDFNFTANGKPVIKIAEIKNGITSQTKFTDGVYEENYYLRIGDMLFCWSGQPETSIDIFWWKGPEGWLNQHIFKVIPKIENKFFFFYLLKYLKPNFVQIAINKQTTGLGHVTKGDLEKFIVRLPKTDEQRAIAAVLSSLDDKIELLREQNKTLEATAQAIFKEWFVNFNFPGATGKMIDSELGEIPEGWRVVNFDEIMKFTPGTYIPKEEYEINGENFIYGSNSVMGNTNQKTHTGPIIILAKIGTYCGAIRFSQDDCWINNNAGGIQGLNISTALIFEILKHFDFSIVREGSGQPYINMSGLKMQKVAIPQDLKSEILKKLSQSIDAIYLKITGSQRQIQTLSKLRDTLLPKLMKGDVRVKGFEN